MAKAGETQDRCTQYALDVVSGKITAGEYVRLACQRHLDDIEKSKAAPYKYYFDVEKSEEIINFAEELTIAEGEENEHVTAYPFQCFILGSLNGWRTKEKSYRRYCHIDYDDDIEILELMLDTTLDEMTELIPNFDRNNLTSRQKLLAFMSVKELYDNRDKYRSDTKTLSAAVSSMLLKEIYGGAAE